MLISLRLMYYQNLQQSAKRMISIITRSRDERGSSNTQHHGVSNLVPVVQGRENKNVLLQVMKQIKIKMKKANKQGKPI